MLSQAMESVTRAFYARSDLDLLLSSPAPAQKIFAVRIATIALSVIAMAALLAAPFINVLAFTDGAHWLDGLRRGRGDGRRRGGRGGIPHHGAVSPDRSAPDPARRTDRRGGDRRRLRHRPAARGDRLGGHDVALRRARLRADPRPRARIPTVRCGGRRAPCSATLLRSRCWRPRASSCSAPRSSSSRRALPIAPSPPPAPR